MTRISILYPRIEHGHFDFDYYLSRHMPRAIELLSAHAGFRGATVERGVAGVEPGTSPGYVAACFLSFDSAEAFMAAFTPHAQELQGDMPHYTNIAAEIQFNEVLLDGAK